MSYTQLASPIELTGVTRTLIVAGSTGRKIDVTGFRASNGESAAVDLLLYDGATLRFRMTIPAGPGGLLALQDSPAMPIIPLDQMTSGGALYAALSGGGSVWLNCYYRYALAGEDS